MAKIRNLGVVACALLAGCSGLEDPPKLPLAIELQPMGQPEASFVRQVSKILEERYRSKVRVEAPIPLPSEAYYAPRKRWRAETLVDALGRARRGDLVVGITQADISIPKPPHKDWGVFGLGSGPLRSCVLSGYRIKNEALLRDVVTHEVGHALGLPHCDNPKCTMADYGGKARSSPEARFCPRCAARVKPYLRWN
jgi:archaemetzincin